MNKKEIITILVALGLVIILTVCLLGPGPSRHQHQAEMQFSNCDVTIQVFDPAVAQDAYDDAKAERAGRDLIAEEVQE